MISIGQLDSTGYAIEFGKSLWKIVKGAMVVARDTKSGTLYTTSGCMNIAVVAESTSNSSLWHNRLGHVRVKGMKMLVAEEVLEDDMNNDQGISIPQGPITRTRAKKLQQTLYNYIQAMVSSSKEILEDVGDLPYMLCKVELQDRDELNAL